MNSFKQMPIYRYSILIALGAVMASCVTKKYQKPVFETPQSFRGTETTVDTLSIAQTPWRDFFRDPILQQHIEDGLKNNLDMKMVLQRVLASRAGFRQSKAAYMPQLSGNAGVRESKYAYPQTFGFVDNSPQYDLGLTASWEADIWGKLSSAKRASLANLLNTEAGKLALQTQLIADIANSYYSLLALDSQLAVLERTANNRSSDVETVKSLKASNYVNGAAVVQSEANYYAAKVAIPTVKAQIMYTENALSLLLGRTGGAVNRARTDNGYYPTSLGAGVPSQLLANRPDVLQAELAFREAFEQTNLARTYFYPAFTITAAGGFTSFVFDDLFKENIGMFGNVAAGLFQPIFNRGTNKARLSVAQARQEEAYFNFQKTVLKAGNEVSNALYSFQMVEERKTDRSLQLESLEKSVDYTKELLKYSPATNYIDVLTSEQILLSAQFGQISDNLEQWQAVINLYRALGGGAK